ncbi:MAG: NAD(P)H-dependent oxidoreductase subunit E [Myxococcota bacterium]|nr:NAD(P)H-dependent oxidoreductase subunit E [Myxococcota bacterium]
MIPGTNEGAPTQVEWTEAEVAQIDEIAARYPTRRSAMLPVLWMAQRKWEWLSLDILKLCAQTLDLPPSEVLAVASFYTMLKKEPTGKYLIQVCQTLPCKLAGCEKMISHLEEALGIRAGQTSEDDLFSLERVECLASCGSAPMMQVNDDFYECLTSERINEILDGFRSGDPLPVPRPEVDQWQWKHES